MTKQTHTKAVRDVLKRQIKTYKGLRGQEISDVVLKGEMAILHFADGRFAFLGIAEHYDYNNIYLSMGAATPQMLLDYGLITPEEFEEDHEKTNAVWAKLKRDIDISNLRTLVRKYPTVAGVTLKELREEWKR